MDPVQHLHAVVRCLTDTQRGELPQRIINITDSLLLCRTLLVNPKVASLNNKWSAEAVTLNKRFQKLLSSFVHSASVDEQWTASYLLKYIVDFDNIEEVQNLGDWAKGLLTLFSRPSTLYNIKIVSLATLTRIFTFGKEKSRLMRDITTYLLPKLITTCINILERPHVSLSAKISYPQSLPLLESILHCFSKLIPWHPTLFQSSKIQLQKILIRIIAPVSHISKARADEKDEWKMQATANTSSTAMRVYVQLHYLVPKNEIVKEWIATENNIIKAIHTSIKYLKTKKSEEILSVTMNVSKSLAMEARPGLDELGFPSTVSTHEAENQLLALIDLLRHFLATANVSQVEIHLAPIIGAMQRVVHCIGPSGYIVDEQKRPPTDETPIFLSNWVSLYDHVLKLASIILSRFGLAAMSVAGEVMDIMTVAFERGSMIESLRHMFYRLLEQLVQLVGPTMTKPQISILHGIITSCCRDVVNSTGQSQQSSTRKTAGYDHSGTLLSGREKLDNGSITAAPHSLEGYTTQTQDHTRKSAFSLLEALLSKLSPDLIPSSMRSLMERTAILSESKGAMLAGILNRPSVKSNGGKVVASPLPFLARLYPDCLETEGLLRPRVPILVAAVNGKAVIDGNNDTTLKTSIENDFDAHMSYTSADQLMDTSQVEFLNDVQQKRRNEDFENDSHAVQKRARHYNDNNTDDGMYSGSPVALSNSETMEKSITIQNGLSTAKTDHPANKGAACTLEDAHHNDISTVPGNNFTGDNDVQPFSDTNGHTVSNQMTTTNTTDTISNTNATLTKNTDETKKNMYNNIPKSSEDERIPSIIRSEPNPALVPSSASTTNKNNDDIINHENPIPSNPSAPTLESDFDSDDSESFTIPPLVMSSTMIEQLTAANAADGDEDLDDDDDDEGEGEGEDVAVV